MMRTQLTPSNKLELAPEWTVQRWFNTPKDLTIADFRGRVLAVHTFQMLCPGCVSHGLPQTQRLREVFSPDDVAVVGLHTVFEHHEAMTPVSLEAFLHEYRITFPVGVDMPSKDESIPQTMKRYRLRGTPSLLLIDGAGHLRQHVFGRVEDMALGAAVAQLIAENETRNARAPDAGCTGDVCEVEK